MALDILGSPVNIGDPVAIATGAQHGRANLRVGEVSSIGSEGDNPIVRVTYKLPAHRFIRTEDGWTMVPYFRKTTIRKFASQIVRLDQGDPCHDKNPQPARDAPSMAMG